jgi:hypothetical protein
LGPSAPMRRHGLATSVAPTPIGDAGHNTSPIIHYNTNPHIATDVLERYQNVLQVFPTSSMSHPTQFGIWPIVAHVNVMRYCGEFSHTLVV